MRHSPFSLYKFIVNCIKCISYLINQYPKIFIYIQMQETNIDSLKFYISLLAKLKKNEQIDIKNKLISVGIAGITSKHLKFLIQAESRNDQTPNIQVLHQFERKTQMLAEEAEQNLQDPQGKQMVQLKIKALILMKEMSCNDTNLSVITAHQLITLIINPQDMIYVLGLLFRVKSLTLLEKINPHKINTQKLSPKQKEMLFYMLVLIKLNHRTLQAKEILATQLKGKYSKQQLEKDKKAVLLVIKILLEREKELLKSQKPLMIEEPGSKATRIEFIKKSFRNKMYKQYKIEIEKSREDCQQEIAGLNQVNYVLASALFNCYYQNNHHVMQDIQRTKIYKKITFPQKLANQSQIGSASKQNSKLNIKYMKNSEQYSKYLRASSKFGQECAKDCSLGQYFVKHNFNNNKTTLKYIVLNRQKLLWGKNKNEIFEDSTAIKIKNIAGILYGRVSTRLQQSQDSAFCFSFLLKDRTVDLSIAKQKQEEALHRFVIGASYVIRAYHSAERQKWKAEKEMKKGQKEIEQINSKIIYHQYKIRQKTIGKLLWRDIFTNLTSRNSKFNSQLFPKSKLLIHFAKLQHKSERKASSHSESKKMPS